MISMGNAFLYNVVACRYRFDVFALICLSQIFIVINP
jgi:hypothetical protein